MKMLFILIAVVTVSLAACAKKAVTRVTVNVPDRFSGHIHLNPCITTAKEPIVLTDMNEGATAACPSGDVEIEVHKGTKTIVIPQENVDVRRSTDGQPQAINFEVP